jgi:hypothetical protein
MKTLEKIDATLGTRLAKEIASPFEIFSKDSEFKGKAITLTYQVS